MDNMQGTDTIQEGFVHPQGTDTIHEEPVPPQEEISPQDLDSDAFDEYISNLKNSDTPPVHPDTANQAADEPDAEHHSEEPFKTFDTEEDFQSFMNKAIGERLKSAKQTQHKYEDILRRAKGLYGGDDPDFAINKMFDDLERQAAADAGQSFEEYKENQQMRMDAAAYRDSVAKQNALEEAIRAKQEEWNRDSQQLKAIIPDFDFLKAMENKDFSDAVLNGGMSVAAAYIKTANQTGAAEAAARTPVHEIGSRGGIGAAAETVNPVNMSDRDFSAYIANIKSRG